MIDRILEALPEEIKDDVIVGLLTILEAISRGELSPPPKTSKERLLFAVLKTMGVGVYTAGSQAEAEAIADRIREKNESLAAQVDAVIAKAKGGT